MTSKFSETVFAKVIETGELVDCGSFMDFRQPGSTESEIAQLSHVVLRLIRNGTPGGSEQMRVKLYLDSAFSKVAFASAWVTLSTIPDFATAGAWDVRFDFENPFLEPGAQYYFGVETANYTRNAEVYWLALGLDVENATLRKVHGDFYITTKRASP